MLPPFLPPKHRLKKYAFAVLAFALVKLVWVYLMGDSGAAILQGNAKRDILSRRSFLIARVSSAAAGTDQMPSYLQSQFQGEWALGTYSMLASALTNIAFIYPETRKESLGVIKTLIDRVLTPEIKHFDAARWGEDPVDSLSGLNGHIGYLGHLNWMIGAYRFIGGNNAFDELYHSTAEALSRRILQSPGFCIATYPNELIYVPDNVVVIAALANYARLNNGKYQEVVNQWVENARLHLTDRELGLLPFHLNSSCQPVKGVRGSGAGWNSYYLPFIDKEFASQQFAALKKHFLQKRLITGIREYPRGVWGFGDVDSGPVFLGFSPSGTGFSVGGAAHDRDVELLSKLLFFAELVGSSIEWDNQRQYLIAPLIGDAIMLATKTARVWDSRYLVI